MNRKLSLHRFAVCVVLMIASSYRVNAQCCGNGGVLVPAVGWSPPFGTGSVFDDPSTDLHGFAVCEGGALFYDAFGPASPVKTEVTLPDYYVTFPIVGEFHWEPGTEADGKLNEMTDWGAVFAIGGCWSGANLEALNAQNEWSPVSHNLPVSSLPATYTEPGVYKGERLLRVVPSPTIYPELDANKGRGETSLSSGSVKAVHVPSENIDEEGDVNWVARGPFVNFKSGLGMASSTLWGGYVALRGNLWDILHAGANEDELDPLSVVPLCEGDWYTTDNGQLLEIAGMDNSFKINVISSSEIDIEYYNDTFPANGTVIARHKFIREEDPDVGFGSISYPVGLLYEEDPDDDDGTANSNFVMMGVLETRDQSGAVTAYAWARKEWKEGEEETGYTLVEGEVTISGGTRELTLLTGGASTPALEVYEEYHLFPWGEALVERIEDPSGQYRKTTYDYYHENDEDRDSYSRLRKTVSYSGAVVTDWSYFTYDHEAENLSLTPPLPRKAIMRTYGPWLSMTPPVGTPTLTSLRDGIETETWSYFEGNAYEGLLSATVVRVDELEIGRTERVTYTAGESPDEMFIEAERTYTGASLGESLAYLETAHANVLVEGGSGTLTFRRAQGGKGEGSAAVPAALDPEGFQASLACYAQVVTGSGAPTLAFDTGQPGEDSYEYELPVRENRSVLKRRVDLEGLSALEELYVWTEADESNFLPDLDDPLDGYELMTSTIYVRDGDGRVTERWKDGFLEHEASYGTTETVISDLDGTETITTFDSEGGVVSVERGGVTETTSESFATNAVSTTTSRSDGSRSLSRSRTVNALGDLIAVTDEAGLVTTYSESAETIEGTDYRVSTVTFPDTSTSVALSYMDGRRASVTGTGEVASYYHYTFSGAYLQTTVYIGTDNGDNYSVSVVDHAGRLIEETTSSAGGDLTTAYTYGSNGRLAATTKPDGSVVRREYDALGSVSTDWLDRPSSGGQPADGQKVLASMDEITDYSDGYVDYSDLWYSKRLTSRYLGNDSATKSDVSALYSRLSYDASSGLVDEKFSVNADSVRLTEQTFVDRAAKSRRDVSFYAASTETAESQWLNGRLLSVRELGADTPSRFGYDGFGRVTSVSDPSTGRRTLSHYSDSGQLDYETDLSGNPTRYEYYGSGSAGAGRIHRVLNAAGKDSVYSYNLRGQLTSVRGSAEYPVDFGYHATYAWRTSMTTYRNLGGAGDTTHWDYYTESGQLKWKRDARNDSSKQVSYTYDENGRLAVRTWARDRATSYSYDSLGRLSGIDYDGTDTPDVTGIKYDRGGRLMNVTDAAGTRTLTHRASGDEASDTLAGGSGILAGYEVVHGYGSGFNTSLIVNEGTNKRYQNLRNWDADDRRLNAISFVGPNPFATMRGKVEFDYAPGSGRKEAQRFRRGTETTDRFKTSFVPDFAGRLGSIRTQVVSTGITASAHSYRFDSLNRRVRAIRENGSFWAYNYNDRGELAGAEKHLRGDDYPLAGHQWEYAFDDIGNRLTMKSGGDASGNSLRTTTYGSGAKGGSANLLNQYEAISNPSTFDIVGTDPNVLGDGPEDPVAINIGGASLDGQPLSAQPKTHYRFNVPANNGSGPSWQDITVTDSSGIPHAAGGHYSPAATQTIGSTGYDDDGNVVNDGRWAYTWNCENQLIEMVTTTAAGSAGVPKAKLVFAYDYMGRRISKKVFLDTGMGFPGTPNRHEKFVYEGWNVVLRLDAKNSNGIIQEYYWGPDLSGTFEGAGGVGGLLAVAHFDSPGTTTTPDGFHYVCYDGNGNVSAMLKAADDSVSARCDYDGFGNTVAAEGAFAGENPMGFSTKYTDEETALVYYGYRFYTPTTGSWLGRDPIGEQGGVNLYGFLGNDGLNRWDLLGLDFIAVGGVFADRASNRNFGHLVLVYWPLDCPVPLEDMKWHISIPEKDAFFSKMAELGGNPVPPKRFTEVVPTDIYKRYTDPAFPGIWSVKGVGQRGTYSGDVKISIKLHDYVPDEAAAQSRANNFRLGFLPLISGTPEELEPLWDRVFLRFKSYEFAEERGFTEPQFLPNSVYGDPYFKLRFDYDRKGFKNGFFGDIGYADAQAAAGGLGYTFNNSNTYVISILDDLRIDTGKIKSFDYPGNRIPVPVVKGQGSKFTWSASPKP